MSFKLLNRVRMSVASAPGTSASITVGTNAVGFQSFVNAGMSDGDQTTYLLEDGSPIGSSWEIGTGTWHSSGTFTRDTITQSSAGGTTPITASINTILSATLQASDLMSAAGGVSSTAPIVVQHAYIYGSASGTITVTLPSAPTPGNTLIAIGNCAEYSGAHGFNFTAADNQYNENSTTAWTVGYGFRTVHSGDSATVTIGTLGTGTTFSGLVLEVSGVDLAALTEAAGTLGTSSTVINASNFANSLSVFFVGGDSAATPTITAPASFQVSQFSSSVGFIEAGWNTITGAGSAGVTGSLASGANGALVLNIPG